MDKKLETTGKLLVAAAIIAWLLHGAGLENVLKDFSRIGGLPFALGFALSIAVVFVNSYGVYALYLDVTRIPFRRFIRAYLASWVLGYLTPGKVGGSLITIFLKEHVEPGKAAAIFVIDKAVTVALALAIGFYMLTKLLTATEILAVSGGTLLTGAAALFLFYSAKGRALLRSIMGDRAGFFTGYAKSYPLFMNNPRGTMVNALMTVVRFAVQGIILQVFFAALGLDVSWANMVLLVCAGAILSMAPFTFSGLGVKETAFVFLCTRMGLPAAQSTAVAFSSTIVSWAILVLFTGALWEEVKNAGNAVGKSPQ